MAKKRDTGWRAMTRADVKGVTCKDMREVIMLAMDAGAVGRWTGKRHLLIRLNGGTLSCAGTPSSPSSARNARATVERLIAGAER